MFGIESSGKIPGQIDQQDGDDEPKSGSYHHRIATVVFEPEYVSSAEKGEEIAFAVGFVHVGQKGKNGEIFGQQAVQQPLEEVIIIDFIQFAFIDILGEQLGLVGIFALQRLLSQFEIIDKLFLQFLISLGFIYPGQEFRQRHGEKSDGDNGQDRP